MQRKIFSWTFSNTSLFLFRTGIGGTIGWKTLKRYKTLLPIRPDQRICGPYRLRYCANLIGGASPLD